MTTAARTFAEKALARAASRASARAGEIVQVRPDRILSHDNTAAIAEIFYQELGGARVVEPDRLCITLDHAVPPPTAQHARNHTEIRAFVRDQGIQHFFEVGRGICHQVLSEEALIWPGQVILGADSHTTHFGWLGAFGCGVGRSEVAALWLTGELWLRVPESQRVTLTGQLPLGVTSKDLALAIVGDLGADGAVYSSLEFSGDGLMNLSLESRMVLPNVMAETGVKNAYLPPDEPVFDYLADRAAHRICQYDAQDLGRACALLREEIERSAMYPGAGAIYETEQSLDLCALQPMVACPPDVDNVHPLAELAGQRVDMAFIGTCTNGRLEDLASAAEVLRGRRVSPSTRLLVIPASREILEQALHLGILQTLLEAGAVIGVPGCGPCMGNHFGVPGPGEVVISSANRNFRGRMGQPDAEIYLASPAVVAASAVAGRIAHPAEILSESKRTHPLSRSVPSSAGPLWHVTSPASGEGHRPSASAMPRDPGPAPAGDLAGAPPGASRVWKYGDHINTDLIFPGKYTYTLRDPHEIAAHAMEDLDPRFAHEVQRGDVVIAGRNFGCGSSREQAAAALKTKGVAAVVAVSFARIFYRNAINRGLPTIICPGAAEAARSGDWVLLDIAGGWVELPGGRFSFPPFPENIQALLKAGGLIPFLRPGEAGRGPSGQGSRS
ncbi:MAG: aconitase/3-isopropylmalate dehydratase large subunit family protein [Anaerolineales bacterium]|jgi:3-isopropylmalate/(R)-2-methylmalate dehydratase large subunit